MSKQTAPAPDVDQPRLVRPRRSPLDALIDKACGYAEPKEPEPRRIATEDEKADAASVASDVIIHITDMYPRVWDNVPKTARVSIRNTVYNRVVALLLSRANVESTDAKRSVR